MDRVPSLSPSDSRAPASQSYLSVLETGSGCDAAGYHRRRARLIARAHPEVRAFLGPYAPTAAWIAGMATLQIMLAAFMAGKPAWAIVALAGTIGAVIALALWALLHECTHDLVFRRASWNKVLGIIAGLPLIIPAAASFRKYHILHHRHLADPVLDGDVPSAWENRLFGRNAWGKAGWMLCNPLLISLRPSRMKAVRMIDRWLVANFVAQGLFVWAMAATLGWAAVAFCLLSNLFALGLHPFGARLVQEHFEFREGQPTTSYYGAMNHLVFNAGFHLEHHDFMRISWHHLPAVRSLAPEFYDAAFAHRSWSRLAIAFIFDRRMNLQTRRGDTLLAQEPLYPDTGQVQPRGDPARLEDRTQL